MEALKGKRLDVTLALLLFAFGLLLRLLLLAPFHFDGLYGQDAYAYYDFAGELRQAVSGTHTLGPFFWPLGYPALLATAFSLFGTQAVVGQAISVLAGAMLAPLVYVLARQVGCRQVGAFAAGVLMAVCGQVLQSSLVLMADIPALAWAVISAVVLWRTLGNRRWLVAAGVALAMASITRWLYLALVVPWGLALLLSGRTRLRDVIVALVPAGMIVLLQLAYSSTSSYPTFNHAWVEGWSVANAFRSEFTNVDGHFVYEMENWRYYAQPFYEPYYLAPIFTPFLLIGVGALVRQKRYPQLAFLLGWALLPFLFLAGIPYQNIRFPLIVFPAVAVLAGVGLESALGWFQRQRRLAYAGRIGFVIILLLGARETLVAAQRTIDTFIANQQRDKDTAAWADEQIPAGSTLYTFGLTLTLKHYTTLNVYEIYYESPETLAEQWAQGQDDYLLLDVWNIEQQWSGREPQIAYHWLRDTRGLVEMGRYGNYTLFRVAG